MRRLANDTYNPNKGFDGDIDYYLSYVSSLILLGRVLRRWTGTSYSRRGFARVYRQDGNVHL